LEFGPDGNPSIIDPQFSRTFEDTIVWAAVPSPDGRAWWQANGYGVGYWPLLTDGFATATLQERPSGARIVTLPSAQTAKEHLSDPLYQRLLLNILDGLS
jgi:hypothetical protein